MAVDGKQAKPAPTPERTQSLRRGAEQQFDWLAKLNVTVAALVQRVSRRVSRTAGPLAALAETGGD